MATTRRRNPKGVLDKELTQDYSSCGSVETAVSVVIVNYNAGVLLINSVEAILRSEIPVSIVVVDNGSSDRSLEPIERMVKERVNLGVIKAGENLGFATANNMGIVREAGHYIALVNPDCVVRPDSLRRLKEVMDAHPEAGIAGCMIHNEDGTEQVGTRRAIPTPWLTLVRILRLNRLFPNDPRFRDFNEDDLPLPDLPASVEAVSGALMFVRREALEEVGVLDEGYFLHCEDLDWFMRFQQAGWKILFVPDAEAIHIKGACSQAEPIRVLWHKHRGMLRFYRKFYRERYPRALMWAVAVAVWARFGLLGTGILLKRAVAR
jgi:GT2 family glycosyltransferase